jgi:acyl-ACP thioesterase
MVEFVGRPQRGRTFSSSRPVRLSDAGIDGRLRVDGLARYLQDAGSDDWADAGIVSDDLWVARRTSWRLREFDLWPQLADTVTLTTWCGGTGAAWAERRTDVEVGGTVLIEAASLWVPIGGDGRPRRVRPEFFDVYGSSADGRRVPGRVATPPVAIGATRREWSVRRSDLDVIGHVNNAAVWSAVAEVIPAATRAASVTHHGAIEYGDVAELAFDASHVWLLVGDDIRVSGEFEVS